MVLKATRIFLYKAHLLVVMTVASLICSAAQAQQQPAVKGVVQDSTGQFLFGVTVGAINTASGYTTGVVTDEKGVFQFGQLPEGPYTFRFSSIGYAPKEMTGYSIRPGMHLALAVKMEKDNKALDEVIVVGYGTQKRANLTGAVDQVGGEVLENRSMPNLSQGLQGTIANLNLVPQDGKPIQSPAFNIRGNTSIGQRANALVLIDGVESDPSLVNPNDIATVTVLKDASSAAIYGARGAFGVVLITTKSPVKGKTNVTYSVKHSFKDPIVTPDMVTDGYQWATMFNEAWTAANSYSQTPQNVNKTIKFSPDYLAELKRRSEDPSLPRVEVNPAGEYVYYYSTDWNKLLYKDFTQSTEHNISVSGGADKAGYLLTGRYYNQDGLFRYNSDDYHMYNFRAKGYIQLYPWLRINNNTDFASMTYHNPLNVGEGGSIWRNLEDEGHPMAPLLNPDGTLSYSAAYTVGDFYYGRNGIDMDRRVIKNTTGFEAQLFGNQFRLRGDFTFQNTDNNEKQLRVPVAYSRKPGVKEYVGTNTNDIQNVYRETQYLASNLYGEYENRFGGQHYFKAMLGFNYEQSTYKALQTLRNGLIYDGTNDINLALGQSITTSGGWERWNIAGGFYRLNYAFKDRYLVEASGRYDGSSKFPSDQRYAFFPSVSAGWRVSKESFWHVPEKAISDLKIRASFGSLGNGNISSYQFQEKFAISQSGRVLNGVRPQKTSQPGVLPDGLTWETVTMQNIGLDMAMLNDRLTFSGDAYIRDTKNMFTVGMTLPAVFGTDVPKGNYADMRTKGWELALTWKDRFSVASKPFQYGIRVTLADYMTKITKYNNPDKKLSDYYVGQDLGEIWGYITEGFYKSEDDIAKSPVQNVIKAPSGKWLPGDLKFRDVNGDGVIDAGDNTVSKPGDRVIIGNATPRYTYGIKLDADWNNIFFSVFFQGVGRQDWWPGPEASTFWGQYNRPYNDPPKWQLDKIWSESNPNTYLPRYRGYVAQSDGGELRAEQTRYLQRISYIRMKNIQLGYNLPQQLLGRMRMSSARVYVSAENFWTWSPLYRLTRDLDVENTSGSDRVLTNGTNGNGNNYPMLKGITLGLSVTL